MTVAADRCVLACRKEMFLKKKMTVANPMSFYCSISFDNKDKKIEVYLFYDAGKIMLHT